MTISIHKTYKKLFFIFCAMLYLQPVYGCSVNKQQVKLFPYKSFVQIYNTVDIKKCKKNSPCKTGPLRSVGSGSVIDHHNGLTLILTAGHVCQSSLNPEIDKLILEKENSLLERMWDGSMLEANILFSSLNPAIDLCSIYIMSHNKPVPKISISKKRPIIGQEVVAMSAPLGIYHPPVVPLLQGRFSGDLPNSHTSIVTVPSQPGSSGAPVLNEDRQIIGVIYAVNSAFNHVTLSVNYSTVRDFIEHSLKLFKTKNMSTPIKVINQ